MPICSSEEMLISESSFLIEVHVISTKRRANEPIFVTPLKLNQQGSD